MRTQTVPIAVGILAVAACGSGVAAAGPTSGPPSPSPPPPAVVSELLARGGAEELSVTGRGVRLQITRPTDVALVKATLAPGRETGWHRHAGPSTVIVKSGVLTMRGPSHGHRHHGCTTRTFGPGRLFAHPADVHNFVNRGTTPVEFYISYFLPAGASPAPIPVAAPEGCA